MPAGIAEVAFAGGDGQNVAFGNLGSNIQQVVRVADSLVGHFAGDVVGISRKEGDGAVLELWSMRDAAPIRTLATVDGGTIFDSWVDMTHQQVFYGITRLGGHEYRRVGLDGTGDTSIASAVLAIRYAQATLAVDDAQFVAEWCPIVGSCERVIHDTATAETRQAPFDGDPVCSINGVLDGRIIATTSRCDAGVDEGVVAARDLGSSEWTTLLDDWASVLLVDGSAGPQAVLLEADETWTVVWLVGLDGTGLREIATIDHEQGMGAVIGLQGADHSLQVLLEFAPVGQPGQIVMAGMVLQGSLQHPVFGDVAQDADHQFAGLQLHAIHVDLQPAYVTL